MHRGLFGTWLPRHSSGILQIAADALQSRIQRDRDPLGQGLHLHLRLYGTSHSTTFCHSRLPPGYTRSLKIRHLESQGICLRIAPGNYAILKCTPMPVYHSHKPVLQGKCHSIDKVIEHLLNVTSLKSIKSTWFQALSILKFFSPKLSGIDPYKNALST